MRFIRIGMAIRQSRPNPQTHSTFSVQTYSTSVQILCLVLAESKQEPLFRNKPFKAFGSFVISPWRQISYVLLVCLANKNREQENNAAKRFLCSPRQYICADKQTYISKYNHIDTHTHTTKRFCYVGPLRCKDWVEFYLLESV